MQNELKLMAQEDRTAATTGTRTPQIATGSTIQHRGCAACRQVWPENMMVAVGGRWMCALCKERALEDQIPANKKRYRMSSGVPNYAMWSGILIGLLVFMRVGGIRLILNLMSFGGSHPEYESKPEPWASKPVAEWPRVVATGEGSLDTSTFRSSSNVFFVKKSDGGVLGITVASLADEAADFTDENVAKLRKSITEWNASADGKSCKLGTLRPSSVKAAASGVLLLDCPDEKSLPAKALNLRPRSYGNGMKFHVVSTAKNGAQRDILATVVDNASTDGSETVTTFKTRYATSEVHSGDGSASTFRLTSPAKPSEIVGSPLVDFEGHLGAVLVAPLDPEKGDAPTDTFVAFGMNALRDAVAGKPPTKAQLQESDATKKPDAAPTEETPAKGVATPEPKAAGE